MIMTYTRKPACRIATLVLATVFLAGCSKNGDDGKSLSEVQQADFSTATVQEENQLVRPPNVISEVDRTLLRIDQEGISRLLPEISKARLIREGSNFWLEVDHGVEEVWSVLRDFWQSEGFNIEIEVPETGLIETEWRQDRSKVIGVGLSRYLDLAFERVNDTGERYRFRSRIERGERPETTLVFISHRAIHEAPNPSGPQFRPLPNDPTLEAEMLRRLMLRFRLDDESIARVEDFERSAETNDLYELADGTLLILRGREQAWLLLLQALDRGGYTLVDKDQEAGSVTIRTADPTIDQEDLGFLDTLLGTGQEDGEPFEAEIAIRSAGTDRTEVLVPEGELGESILDVLVTNI